MRGLKPTVAAALLMLAAAANSSHAEVWRIDPANSSIRFEVDHFVISTVSGDFREFRGRVESDDAEFSGARVETTIEAASIDTGNAARDEHLHEGSFLGAEAHPQLRFSGIARPTQQGSPLRIDGELTLKGITRPLTLEGHFRGRVRAMGRTRAGFRATGSLDRFDFDVRYNELLESGGLAVGRTVDIILDIELVLEETS